MSSGGSAMSKPWEIRFTEACRLGGPCHAGFGSRDSCMTAEHMNYAAASDFKSHEKPNVGIQVLGVPTSAEAQHRTAP